MESAGPAREDALLLSSSGMCRSTRPSSKSRSLCRYKTASDLFIPLALETAYSQAFARKHGLTPAFCADVRNREGGRWRGHSCPRALRDLAKKRQGNVGLLPMFSFAYALPCQFAQDSTSVFSTTYKLNFGEVLYSQAFTHSQGRGGAGKSLAFILWKEIACESA